MSIIRTSHGTLEFRQTPNGPIVVINGEHLISLTDLLLEFLDIYYRKGLTHPRGSTGYLEELTGLTFDNSCPLCGGPDDMTRCPQCSIGRCFKCVALHDGGSLCRLTREYADVHRQMREGDELTEIDFYMARKFMVSTYIHRSQH